jgi:hypothetical protein
MINLKRKKYREDHRGIVSRRIQIQSIIIFIIGLNQTTPSIVTKFIESEWKKKYNEKYNEITSRTGTEQYRVSGISRTKLSINLG